MEFPITSNRIAVKSRKHKGDLEIYYYYYKISNQGWLKEVFHLWGHWSCLSDSNSISRKINCSQCPESLRLHTPTHVYMMHRYMLENTQNYIIFVSYWCCSYSVIWIRVVTIVDQQRELVEREWTVWRHTE